MRESCNCACNIIVAMALVVAVVLFQNWVYFVWSDLVALNVSKQTYVSSFLDFAGIQHVFLIICLWVIHGISRWKFVSLMVWECKTASLVHLLHLSRPYISSISRPGCSSSCGSTLVNFRRLNQLLNRHGHNLINSSLFIYIVRTNLHISSNLIHRWQLTNLAYSIARFGTLIECLLLSIWRGRGQSQFVVGHHFNFSLSCVVDLIVAFESGGSGLAGEGLVLGGWGMAKFTVVASVALVGRANA